MKALHQSGPAPAPRLKRQDCGQGPPVADRREIELKFHLAARRAPGVRREILAAGGAVQGHRARYFDTPDGVLSRHGVSLRLRQQDARWVQTVKVSDGRGNAGRWEHEVVLPGMPKGQEPTVDPRRHEGTAAGQALRRLLNAHPAPLEELHGTQVQRWASAMKTPGAVIEVSLDQGVLRAGDEVRDILEVEFELKAGPIEALLEVCADWIRRHGLWLASESKAELGARLRARAAMPVVKARPSSASPGQSAQDVMRAVLRDCAAQILPNAAAVAAGSTDADHVHQLRVGLRRLRTAIRELGGLLPQARLASLEEPLARTFRTLGDVRDSETVVAALSPRLAAAGASQVPWRATGAEVDLAGAVRESGFQVALASVLIHALAEDEMGPGRPAGARRMVKKRLKALHEQLEKNGRRFRRLDIDAQHRVRKRLKRMRYLTEFVQPLFPAGKVERYLALMRPAQDELGLHNDYAVALSLVDEDAAPSLQDDAAIAMAWLGCKLRKSDRRSQKALRRLQKKAPHFWRPRKA